MNGSPADTSVVFDLEFFDHCNTFQVSCFGTWHNAGHNFVEPGVNLPWYQRLPGPDTDIRLDNMLVAFTNSTANHQWCGVDAWGNDIPCARGHFNLGLAWNTAQMTDTATQVVMPIRYQRTTGISGGVPDQPISATFDATVRRVKNLPLTVGTVVNWVLGAQRIRLHSSDHHPSAATGGWGLDLHPPAQGQDPCGWDHD